MEFIKLLLEPEYRRGLPANQVSDAIKYSVVVFKNVFSNLFDVFDSN